MTDTAARNPYDEVPYPSAPKPETHPDRLATLAMLFGMTPAPADRCRVLELGCSDGGNIIPMAQTLPGSEFVGVDLSARQIESGLATIEALGLRNVRLQPRSILDVTPDIGQFDYLICYGVYSWVPRAVQDKILEISRQCLRPNGVALVSYNTFPGWHMHLMIREMMLYHTRRSDDLSQSAKQARSFLKYLIESADALSGRFSMAMDTGAFSVTLKREEAVLENRPDLYLVHEHLERENLPVYFHEFAGQAARHGLQYLAESHFFTMHLSNFPPSVAEPLEKMELSLIETEQYMDFLRNRSFRQTLLCHDDVVLDRSLPPDRLKSLYVCSPIAPASKDGFDLKSDGPEKFVAPNDVTVSVSTPLAKAALLYLHETWPAVTLFDDLLAKAHYRLDPTWLPVQSAERFEQDTQALADMLLQFYVADIVELHVHPPAYVVGVSERPVASPIARHLAQYGPHVVSLRHETVTLEDDVSHQVLKNLDGSRDRSALLALLVKSVEDGALVIHAEGKSDTAASPNGQGRQVLSEALERSLQRLSRAALLTG